MRIHSTAWKVIYVVDHRCLVPSARPGATVTKSRIGELAPLPHLRTLLLHALVCGVEIDVVVIVAEEETLRSGTDVRGGAVDVDS